MIRNLVLIVVVMTVVLLVGSCSSPPPKEPAGTTVSPPTTEEIQSKSSRSDPEAWAWLAKGESLAHEGQNSEALYCLTKGLDKLGTLDLLSAVRLMDKADVLNRLEHPEAARFYIEKAREHGIKPAKSIDAMTLWLAGKSKQALEMAEAAVSDKREIDALNLRLLVGVCAYDTGDADGLKQAKKAWDEFRSEPQRYRVLTPTWVQKFKSEPNFKPDVVWKNFKTWEWHMATYPPSFVERLKVAGCNLESPD